MKILITGVIVGSTGRKALARYLEYLSEKDEKPDFVVANGNFAAGGIGLSEDASREMFDAGVDVITTGENVWDQKTLQDIIDTQPRILRPCNLPENSPGKGTVVVPAGPGGVPVGVINLSGYSFIQRILPDNPFPMIRGIIDIDNAIGAAGGSDRGGHGRSDPLQGGDPGIAWITQIR